MHRRSLSGLTSGTGFLLLVLFLSGCGGGREELAAYDNEEEVKAFYAANPGRFTFATLDDLPEGLEWEAGSGLPEIGDPAAKRGGHLRLRVPRLQSTLRVVGPEANGSLRGMLWQTNMVFLIHRHPWANGYIPGLARRWAIDSDNRQRLFFELDPDARWSDGRPFSAEDFFFSLYLLLSPHIQDPAINRVYEENTSNITDYGDGVMSITLGKPSPDPLYSLQTFILFQREFYREFGPDYVDRYHSRFAPVTGPYTLDTKDIVRGERITFRRMSDWWAADKPYFRHRFNVDEITYVVIRDDFKAFESFLNGSVDWFSLNPTELWYDRADAPAIRDGYVERAQVYDLIPAGSQGLFMNSAQPLLDNPDLRVGIQYAINYDRVNEEIHRGDRRRIRSFTDGYGKYDNPDLRALPFNIDQALDWFAKAGFTERGSDGILQTSDGTRLSFTFSSDNSEQNGRITGVLKEEALKAGLELRIELLDPTAFFTKVFEKKHQTCLFGWSTGYATVPTYEWELRGADAGKPKNFNTTNIQTDRLDELLAEWDTLDDPERAHEVSHQIQQEVHDYAAWVPGLTTDFSRWGYWRWVRWPDYFQVPKYFMFIESGVFWIDEEMQKQTLEARKRGETFPPLTQVYDRWKRGE